MSIPIPTMIIAPPRLVGGKFILAMNDGLEYTVRELADIKEVTRFTILRRIEIYGWQSPYILAPPTPKGSTLEGLAPKNGDGGNEAWRALSDKARGYNLKKIKPFGRYECGTQIMD